MDDDEEIEEDEPVDQPKNSQKKGRADHLAPWQFKNGQSGNPLGRTPGKSMKEFAKEYLSSLTDEERLTVTFRQLPHCLRTITFGRRYGARCFTPATPPINNLSKTDPYLLHSFSGECK